MQTNLGDGSSTDIRTHEFATRQALLRKALEFHQDWIETTLGVAIADVVIFQIDLNLAQIGVEKILACSNLREASRAVRRLRPLVVSADTPQGFPPLVELSKLPHKVGLAALFEGWQTRARLSLEWHDCPVAIGLHGITAPVIAFNLYYHSGLGSHREGVANLLVTRRECAAEVVQFVETSIAATASRASMSWVGGRAELSAVLGMSWCWTSASSRCSETISNRSLKGRPGFAKIVCPFAVAICCMALPATEKAPPSGP
jgi:hypothetical protein